MAKDKIDKIPASKWDSLEISENLSKKFGGKATLYSRIESDGSPYIEFKFINQSGLNSLNDLTTDANDAVKLVEVALRKEGATGKLSTEIHIG